MKILKKFILLLILVFTLCINFNSHTSIITSKTYFEGEFDYVKLSDFRFKGDTVNAGGEIGISCYFSLPQILGGHVSFKSDEGITFNGSFSGSAQKVVVIPSNVKPGKYYVTEIQAGGTGRDGGMVVKTFRDPEIFKDQYLIITNDNYIEEPVTQSTSRTTIGKKTTSSSETTEATTKTTNTTNKRTKSKISIPIDFTLILVVVSLLLVIGLIFFLKAIHEDE